jgi:hypothetical protein
MDKQRDLMEADTDVRTLDMMKRQLAAAKAEWQAEPNEPGKLMKYVDILRKTERRSTKTRPSRSSRMRSSAPASSASQVGRRNQAVAAQPAWSAASARPFRRTGG